MTTQSALQTSRDNAVQRLISTLGENLCACIEYGSTVRGDAVPGVSDLNLLIVLNEPTPEAHAAIAEAIRGPVRIEPFVVGKEGMARRFESFAVKFMSIRRHYRVLHGMDPLAGMTISPEVERFLCEQAVRNLHLRSVRSYIVFGHDPKRYTRYLVDSLPGLFTSLSEILRLEKMEIPAEFLARVPIFEKAFQAQAGVLTALLEAKKRQHTLSPEEIPGFHARLFQLLSQAISWIEKTWPRPTPATGR